MIRETLSPCWRCAGRALLASTTGFEAFLGLYYRDDVGAAGVSLADPQGAGAPPQWAGAHPAVAGSGWTRGARKGGGPFKAQGRWGRRLTRTSWVHGVL